MECRGATAFLAGSGADPYLLAVTEADMHAVRSITFSATESEVAALRMRLQSAEIAAVEIPDADEPGGGVGLSICGPEHQNYRFLTTATPSGRDVPQSCLAMSANATDKDTPVQLTHVVVNTCDLASCEQFSTDLLGFQISDRTRAMTFVRCGAKHHCVAYAPAAMPSLNHIAFEMVDADAVMRGIGRMRDAGVACSWGPGRHGPGNNIFAYFVAPFGGVIEYTAEVAELGSDHRVGTPADWTWPPGRIDQWGISTKDVAAITAAERQFPFLAPA